MSWLAEFVARKSVRLIGIAIVGAGGVAFGVGIGRVIWEGRALRAKNELAEWKLAGAEAANKRLSDSLVIGAEVRDTLNEQKTKLADLAGDLSLVRRDARLCASNSLLPAAGSPAGAAAPPASGQHRDAAEVLQELAAERFRRADTNALEHNALVDFLEKVRKRQE